MNRRESFDRGAILGDRLRDEGRDIEPRFSHELHVRMIAALRDAGAQSSAPARTGRGTIVAWVMAAAALLALAVGLVVLQRAFAPARATAVASDGALSTGFSRNEASQSILPSQHGVANVLPPKGGATNHLPPAAAAQSRPNGSVNATDLDSATDDLATAASGIGDWMQSAADDLQWLGLDRDAQAALDTVTAPLPFDVTVSVATSEPDER